MSDIDPRGPLFDIDPREEKLPVWAKELLKLARRRTRDAEATAEAARLDTDPGGCDLLLDRYGARSEPIGLGDRARVIAVVDRYSSGEPRNYIEFSAVEGGAEIRASHTLRIEPSASNAVSVSVKAM